MSTTLGLTVGDTGITLSGTFTQKGLGDLADMIGCSAKFSLIKTGEGGSGAIVDEAAAVIGTFDASTSSVKISYKLKTPDVAVACPLARVRWTIILPDGSKIHAPGPLEEQTYVRISA